jgi:hypothetical protein
MHVFAACPVMFLTQNLLSLLKWEGYKYCRGIAHENFYSYHVVVGKREKICNMSGKNMKNINFMLQVESLNVMKVNW